MNIHDKAENILGQYSSLITQMKLDVHISEASENLRDSGGLQPPVAVTEEDSMNTELADITLTSDFGGNDGYNYERASKINCSFNHGHDGSSIYEDENLDMTFKSSPQVMREKFSKTGENMPEPENTNITVDGAAFTGVRKEEKMERGGACDGTVSKTTSTEQKQFRDVSVQTTEGRQITCDVSTCPLRVLRDENLKDKLTDYCPRLPPYKKRKVSSACEGSAEDETCEGNEEGNSKEKPGFPQAEILSEQISSFQNIEGGRTDLKEFSCKTIRVGLSRRVKLPPLHKMPAFGKKHVLHSG